MLGPAFYRAREGFLRAFLGEIPVAGEADEARDNAPPLVVEDCRDRQGDIGC
jgi:hypothetical protein